MKTRFTEDDVARASNAWGCNCGPAALAAIVGKTLDEVHPHIPKFDERHYTNPSMMFKALHNLNIDWKPRFDKQWPDYGLARIQWHGPWMDDGVPVNARYRKTHWIGVHCVDVNVGIFDINAMNSGGWIRLQDWKDHIVPFILTHYPKANGDWSITHSLEVIAPHIKNVYPPSVK